MELDGLRLCGGALDVAASRAQTRLNARSGHSHAPERRSVRRRRAFARDRVVDPVGVAHSYGLGFAMAHTAPVVRSPSGRVQLAASSGLMLHASPDRALERRNRLIMDLPRFRGEVRSWDQGIWFDGILSSSFE